MRKLSEKHKEELIARFEFQLSNSKSVFNLVDTPIKRKILGKVRQSFRNAIEE